MKFVLTQSLLQDTFGKKDSKILKIMWDHATLPKTGLAPVGPIRPLGIKDIIYSLYFHIATCLKFYFCVSLDFNV
jgi:hypothetical protein